VVMDEAIGSLFCSKVFNGIGPEDIAHQAVGWRFPEAVDLSTPTT
jgi:hypothetical protein